MKFEARSSTLTVRIGSRFLSLEQKNEPIRETYLNLEVILGTELRNELTSLY